MPEIMQNSKVTYSEVVKKLNSFVQAMIPKELHVNSITVDQSSHVLEKDELISPDRPCADLNIPSSNQWMNVNRNRKKTRSGRNSSQIIGLKKNQSVEGGLRRSTFMKDFYIGRCDKSVLKEDIVHFLSEFNLKVMSCEHLLSARETKSNSFRISA